MLQRNKKNSLQYVNTINELNIKHDQTVIDLQDKLDAVILQLNSSKPDGNGGTMKKKKKIVNIVWMLMWKIR